MDTVLPWVLEQPWAWQPGEGALHQCFTACMRVCLWTVLRYLCLMSRETNDVAQVPTLSPWTLQRLCTGCSCWASMLCGCHSASPTCMTSSHRARPGTALMCAPFANCPINGCAASTQCICLGMRHVHFLCHPVLKHMYVHDHINFSCNECMSSSMLSPLHACCLADQVPSTVVVADTTPPGTSPSNSPPQFNSPAARCTPSQLLAITGALLYQQFLAISTEPHS